jgi:hypothetical protein
MAISVDTLGKDWSDVPLSEKTQMASLLDQFGQASGYSINLSDATLHEMAKAGIDDFRAFSIYAWDHTNLTDTQRMTMPWLGAGMTHDAYDSAVRQYAAEWKSMTGQNMPTFGNIKDGFLTDPTFQKVWDSMRQNLSPTEWAQNLQSDATVKAANPGAPYGLDYLSTQQRLLELSQTYQNLTGQLPSPELLNANINKAINLTGSEFQNVLLADPKMLETYGWLRYGLNFQQFQQQKLDMRGKFGTDLTDAQAVQQLQYLHAASGSGSSAHGTATSQAQPSTAGQVSGTSPVR